MYRLVSQDHVLIYYEAYRLARRICFVDRAIYHIEPDSLRVLIRKFYRYGRTKYKLTKYYPELSRKATPRKVVLHPDSRTSLILWLLKAAPYALGKALS